MYRIKILAELNMHLSPLPSEVEEIEATNEVEGVVLSDLEEAEVAAMRRLYNMEGITVVYASVVDAQEL